MGGLLSDETPAAPMESEDNEVSSETTALGRNDVNDLIKTGISFLEKLSTSLSDGKSLQPLLSSFVEKDKDTGKTFLKIPVPDEDIINKAVNLFKRDTAGVEKVGMMKGKLFRMRDHL